MKSSRPFGFNVIGYISGNLGLGVSARHLTALLLEKGYQVATLDLDPTMGRARHDLSLDAYAVQSPEDLPYGINLTVLAIPSLPSFFLNPPTIVGGKATLQPGSRYWLADDRLNVAVVWWELAVLPAIWVKTLEVFDVLVAASPFIRATLETHLSNVFTIPATHPLSAPVGIKVSRARFRLPENATIFVTSFEPDSDPERKNPFAAIDAFQRAFTTESRARLVIKLNNAQTMSPILVSTLARLRDKCKDDSRIRIIEETLSYSDVLALYASCDVFVSLHRSEGLGLGLMETMILGKPVIATAWSGNMAFMDHTNSCLVGYKLIPVNATSPVYASFNGTTTWADPSLEQAASWMRRLADDPESRTSLGRKAAMDMAAFQNHAKKAKFADEIRAIWQNDTFLPRRRTEEKVEALQEVRRVLRREQESTLPYGKRLHNQLRRAADKHVLWRFR
jgi:glycosyltransferase involved in cell wall biosynthesis